MAIFSKCLTLCLVIMLQSISGGHNSRIKTASSLSMICCLLPLCAIVETVQGQECHKIVFLSPDNMAVLYYFPLLYVQICFSSLITYWFVLFCCIDLGYCQQCSVNSGFKDQCLITTFADPGACWGSVCSSVGFFLHIKAVREIIKNYFHESCLLVNIEMRQPSLSPFGLTYLIRKNSHNETVGT